MKKKRQYIRYCAVPSVLVFVLVVFCASAGAQTQGTAVAGPGSPSASRLRGGPLGELMSVYTPRNPDEIDRLLDFARSNRQSAENDIAESRRVAQTAEGQVQIMNQELQTTKTRLNVAKKAKNEADRVTLETEVKRQEAEKKYLERLRDAVAADAEWLDRQSSAAAARVQALQLEADVARKYAEINASPVDNPASLLSYRQLVQQMIEARQEAANRASDAASKEKLVVARRLMQLEALAKLQQ